jgi:isopentenyl-diphosphate Delta-isomerase
MNDIFGRKADHLDLSATGDVGFRKTTLLECVELVHDAVPELDFDEIELGCRFLGKPLRAPILIAAMTGGTERARAINLAIAEVAEELGLGFGLGSQRAMAQDPEATASYEVRSVAPTTVVLGNIGGVQATKTPLSELETLVLSVGADALCIHLNPAMELMQAEGDRCFRGVMDTIERLTREFSHPIVVKETGCGISASTARRLFACGVRHVDVSGAGGTSWVAVEAERGDDERRRIGETFREWGIPTAPSVAFCARCGFDSVVATGGIATGLDVARAITLGATVAGIARPLLIAFEHGGKAAVRQYLLRVETELRMAMLLCGARNMGELKTASRLLRAPLAEWLTVLA